MDVGVPTVTVLYCTVFPVAIFGCCRVGPARDAAMWYAWDAWD